MKFPKHLILATIVFVSGWRLVLFAVGAAAQHLLKYAPQFPYATTLLPLYNLPQWVYSWCNFDGVHYLTISEHGYIGFGLIQAFFPVFPFTMRAVNVLLNNTIISGLVISFVSSLALAFSWLWLLSFEKRQLPWFKSLLVLFLFPTSFFLVAVYNESLFLTLVILTFIAARKGWWWVTSITIALATATRIVGVFLIPALILELLLQTAQQQQLPLTFKNLVQVIREVLLRQWPALGFISLGLVGIGLYMSFLWTEFKDALYFLHVQAEFGAGRQETIILYPQVLWRYVKILITYRPFNFAYYSLIQEAVAGTVPLLFLLLNNKYIRPSYLLFSLGAFLLPTLTGTFSSMSRYILVCFGIYIVILKLLDKKPYWFAVYILLSTAWLIFNTILFIQGYWVA